MNLKNNMPLIFKDSIGQTVKSGDLFISNWGSFNNSFANPRYAGIILDCNSKIFSKNRILYYITTLVYDDIKLGNQHVLEQQLFDPTICLKILENEALENLYLSKDEIAELNIRKILYENI